MIPIQDFAAGLSAIPKTEFTRQRVLEFMRANPVAPASLAPFLYFSRDRYTRNLIHRTELFELIAICWESGQKSAIHNHRDQNCWMAAAYGVVQVQNFKLLRKDEASGSCALEPSGNFMITPESPQEVDPGEPIHLVLNPASSKRRAVTLHIYSKPFDTCEVYHFKENRYEVVRLVNTSEFGMLLAERTAELVTL